MNEETRMTVEQSTGASSAKHPNNWQELPWTKISAHVLQLQMRIAKAEREGKKGRVKALQRTLTSSFYAKCLAVKRVTSNKGKKTPGVDGVVLRTSRQKINAVLDLKRRGYNAIHYVESTYQRNQENFVLSQFQPKKIARCRPYGKQRWSQ